MVMFINKKNPILLIEEHNSHLQVIGEQCALHPHFSQDHHSCYKLLHFKVGV